MGAGTSPTQDVGIISIDILLCALDECVKFMQCVLGCL